MTGSEIERLLFYMPVCAEKAATAWLRRFARDMARRAHWRNFKPTHKQIEIMRGMVDDLFGRRTGELIED